MLMACYRATPDEAGRKSRARYLWLECRRKQGRLHGAWRGLGPEEEMFEMIARRLEDDQAWPKLSELIDDYGRSHPGDPVVIHWTARWCEGAKADAKLLELLEPWPAAADKLDAVQKSALKQQLIRACQRLGKKEAAWAMARKLAGEEENVLPLIFLHAAEEDVSQALDCMIRQDAGLYSRGQLYNDVELGKILREPKFLPLREQFPPDLPRTWPQSRSVLLLDAIPANPVQGWKQVLTQKLGPQVSVRDLKASPGAEFVILASSSNGRVILAGGKGKYYNPKSVSSVRVKNNALRASLQQHQAWLAIDVLEPEPDLEATKLCGQVTAALMGKECQAVSWDMRLALADEGARKRLATGPWNARSLESFGEHFRPERDEPSSPGDRLWNQQRLRSLKKLDGEFAAANGAGEFFVLIHVQAGHAVEQPWLKILRIQDSGQKERSFVCVVPTSSDNPLLPKLAPGEPVVIRSYEIRDWKHVSGGKFQFGRSAIK